MRMLLVDEDSAICEGVAKKLAAWHNEIEATPDERTAWTALSEHDYDVLIAPDEMLQEATNSDLELLKSEHPNMAILLLTKTMTSPLTPHNRSLNSALTLSKPFSISQLVDAISGAHRLVHGVPAGHWEPADEPPHENAFRHWGLNE